MPTDASPPAKPFEPSWNGRHTSSAGASGNTTPRLRKWRMFSGVAERSLATTMTSLADAGVEPHLGGQHRRVARGAHRGHVHDRPVEVVALHHQRQHRRRHEVQVLVALQPAVPLEVELLPELDLAEDDRVDHADDRARAASPGRARCRSPRRRPRRPRRRSGSARRSARPRGRSRSTRCRGRATPGTRGGGGRPTRCCGARPRGTCGPSRSR